jgi:outer membrane receptor protein involved in Fe transport
VDLLANGSLLRLPGGLVKAALGVSYRAEEFDTFTLDTIDGFITPITTPTLHRHVSSIFGEFFVPLVGESNAAAWAHSLQFSAAVRYDDYSDFGSTTNPKFGLSWEPLLGIAIQATYGTSFRAPLLNQIGAPVIPIADPVANPGSPSGISDVIIINGGNPGLKPEKSTSYTAGFDVKPAALPNVKMSATYFHIDFRNRITTPPVVGGNYFNDPVIASFLTLNPPLSLVQSYFDAPGFSNNFPGGPTAVNAIFDQREANIAKSTTAGVDLTVSYDVPMSLGRLGFASAIDRLIQNKFQPIAGVPATALLDTFGEPTRWKARGSVSWRSGAFSVMVTGNYVSSYDNTLFTPATGIASWTTGDLFVSYAGGASAPQYLLRNTSFAFSVLNFTNRDPPYVGIPVADRFPGQPGVPFDPTNASPVGRLVSLQITRRW